MLTNGPLVGDLERRIAERLGVAHVVALSSCTSGLMLVIQALTNESSGPVVLPSFTFSASAHAIAWNGLTPRFVECRPDSFQIDSAHAAASLEGASAILATHIFGAPCDPRRLEDIAREHGVPVVFDAAHALGALADGVPIGSFGTAEVFSLTPTKPLVAGEGGLVATNDSALAETLRIGRDYGNPGDYDTRFVGLNARMSEFHAAMALESLELLDESLERRRYLASLYREYLDDVPGIELQAFSSRDTSTFKDDDQGRPRPLRNRPGRSRARVARRRCRHSQVLRPAGTPPARIRTSRAPLPAGDRRSFDQCPVVARLPRPARR